MATKGMGAAPRFLSQIRSTPISFHLLKASRRIQARGDRGLVTEHDVDRF
ncbi:hypothetical protein NKJ17_29050 [Mesorhizobium sp. M0208]